MSPALQALTRGLTGHLAQFGQTAVWRGSSFACCAGGPERTETFGERGMQFGPGWAVELTVGAADPAFANGCPKPGDFITLDGSSREVLWATPVVNSPTFQILVLLSS